VLPTGGRLAQIDSATIVVRLKNGETENVSRAPGTRLDVSVGRRACGGGCIVLGFGGGVAVGALAGGIAQAGKTYTNFCGPSVITVPAGVVLGIVIGAMIKVEHWKSTSIPARLSVGPDRSGRLALGLSVKF